MPADFGQLTNLQALDLSCQGVCNTRRRITFPSEMSKLAALSDLGLHVAGTAICIDLEELLQLPHLAWFHVWQSSGIHRMSPRPFGSAPLPDCSLEHLSLYAVAMQLAAGYLQWLPRLTSLCLVDQKDSSTWSWRTADWAALRRITSLNFLRLRDLTLHGDCTLDFSRCHV